MKVSEAAVLARGGSRPSTLGDDDRSREVEEGLADSLSRVVVDPARIAELHEVLGPFCHKSRNILNSLKISLYLAHRQEPRGVGGIFFDDLASGDLERDFAFVRAVGDAFLGVYPTLVERRLRTPFDESAREKLFYKRGRYVEFNLVYDRGTKFGFGTDADPEAYLMSLPPIVKW